MTTLPLALRPPTSRPVLRPVCLADVDGMQRRCWPDRPKSAIYRVTARAERITQQGYGLGLVAVEGDEVIGYGQCTNWPRAAEISDLVVAEAYRGQGIGTAIIQTLTRAARDMGASCVDIGVALSNTRALTLYRRLGFVDHHHLAIDLNGVRTPVLYLRLSLTDALVQPLGSPHEEW